MNKIRIRRGTTAQRLAVQDETPEGTSLPVGVIAAGRMVFDKIFGQFFFGDDATIGGRPVQARDNAVGGLFGAPAEDIADQPGTATSSKVTAYREGYDTVVGEKATATWVVTAITGDEITLTDETPDATDFFEIGDPIYIFDASNTGARVWGVVTDVDSVAGTVTVESADADELTDAIDGDPIENIYRSLRTGGPAVGAHVEGMQSRVSGQAAHAEGIGSVASNTAAHAEGGYCRAEGAYSHAGGQNCIAARANEWARGYGIGVSRHMLGASRQTTNATPTVAALISDLVDNTLYDCTVEVTATNAAGSAVASYRRRLLVKRVSGTVSLVSSVQTIGTDIEDGSGASGWDISLSVNDSTKAIDLTLTGQSTTTINWLAHVEWNERSLS